MARVARIEQHGGPEVIQWVDSDLPDPAQGEVRIRSTAVGLNFIEIYQRTGLYPLPLPSGLGSESVGVVEALGRGVDRLRDRRPGWHVRPGARQLRDRPQLARRLVDQAPRQRRRPDRGGHPAQGRHDRIPDRTLRRVQPGQAVLVHAAAGGVGHLAVGWLKALGATVIGTVGSADKADRARRAGADHVIEYKTRTSSRE